MAISTDYSRPITVNGYVCRNCDDVSKAKKFEDPSAPKVAGLQPGRDDAAVSFGGALANRRDVAAAQRSEPTSRAFDRYA